MEHLRWIGFGAFFVSSLVIGTRLLLLARRTSEIPELLIGLGVLGIGPFGYGLAMLAFAIAPHSPMLSATLTGSGFLAVFIGAASQYLFIWYVFRRTQRWAQPFVFAAIVLLAASYVGDILDNGLLNRTNTGMWNWIGRVLRLGCLLWSSLESLRYHGRMRRRQRLGLADPVVTNRFLAWGVGAGTAFLGSTLGTAVQAVTGVSVTAIPGLSLVISMHGLVSAVAMWLAFQPPAAYLRLVERRAAAAPTR